MTDAPDDLAPTAEAAPDGGAAPAVAEPAPDEAAPDLSALDGLAAELDAVERALARLDEGTYGTCEACGAAIADEVLAATPTAGRCADHAA